MKKFEHETWKNKNYNISAPTWNEELGLTDWSYSVSDINNYFEYIIKIHKKFTDNAPKKIYVTRIENRIAVKLRYCLEILTPEAIELIISLIMYVSNISDYFEHIIKKLETETENSPIWIYINKIEKIELHLKPKQGNNSGLLIPETIQLLGRTKNKITKHEHGENVSHLEITVIVLVHCFIVNNKNQHDSRVFWKCWNSCTIKVLKYFLENIILIWSEDCVISAANLQKLMQSLAFQK